MLKMYILLFSLLEGCTNMIKLDQVFLSLSCKLSSNNGPPQNILCSKQLLCILFKNKLNSIVKRPSSLLFLLYGTCNMHSL